MRDEGSGPAVVLCHGFPELAYSWRHQIPALVAAGFRALAPDQRGYGDSDRPDDVAAYDMRHLTGDLSACSTRSTSSAPCSSATTGAVSSSG